MALRLTPELDRIFDELKYFLMIPGQSAGPGFGKRKQIIARRIAEVVPVGDEIVPR